MYECFVWLIMIMGIYFHEFLRIHAIYLCLHFIFHSHAYIYFYFSFYVRFSILVSWGNSLWGWGFWSYVSGYPSMLGEIDKDATTTDIVSHQLLVEGGESLKWWFCDSSRWQMKSNMWNLLRLVSFIWMIGLIIQCI